MALQRKSSRRSPNQIVLRPVHPNAGIEAAYQARLDRLIAEMNASVQYWLKAAYRANEPAIAQDETPAAAIQRSMRRLTRRWQRNFDRAADDLAKYFATEVRKRSDATLRNILKKGGFSVEFSMTPEMRDVVQASVNQNVALIKSIPQRYLTNVEGAVMRSVSAGRDLGSLTKDLQEQFGVTRRRAAFIAHDQNNKATASIARCRQNELGLEAKWRHSGGGRHARPTHVAMDGKTYDPKKGMWDSAVQKWIFPGEEPNCRCVSISIVPGFD